MSDRLNELISQTEYNLSCLKLLRDIQNSGSCNFCKYHDDCRMRPNVGQVQRYNCYDFVNKDEVI